jgi:hypothetical protein
MADRAGMVLSGLDALRLFLVSIVMLHIKHEKRNGKPALVQQRLSAAE